MEPYTTQVTQALKKAMRVYMAAENTATILCGIITGE